MMKDDEASQRRIAVNSTVRRSPTEALLFDSGGPRHLHEINFAICEFDRAGSPGHFSLTNQRTAIANN